MVGETGREGASDCIGEGEWWIGESGDGGGEDGLGAGEMSSRVASTAGLVSSMAAESDEEVDVLRGGRGGRLDEAEGARWMVIRC